jgi:hypothetical protein
MGWAPINVAGNLNLGVWERLAEEEELALPNSAWEDCITPTQMTWASST